MISVSNGCQIHITTHLSQIILQAKTMGHCGVPKKVFRYFDNIACYFMIIMFMDSPF